MTPQDSAREEAQRIWLDYQERRRILDPASLCDQFQKVMELSLLSSHQRGFQEGVEKARQTVMILGTRQATHNGAQYQGDWVPRIEESLRKLSVSK